jgi:hypothetical protein
VDDNNFTGTGQFRFALLDGGTGATYWSNGTSAVSLTVNRGLFWVLLGDTNVANMDTSIPASVFGRNDVRLRVWFNDGVAGEQQLSPDQRLAAAPYALKAAEVLVVNAAGRTNFVARPVQTATSYQLTVAGDGAGESATSANGTTLIGWRAGRNLTGGSWNTALGAEALSTCAGQGVNTAVGHQALRDMLQACNTAIGAGAMKEMTNGVANVAVGWDTMGGSRRDGDYNTALGSRTMRNGTVGSENVCIGYQAGYYMDGSHNIGIGYEAAMRADGSYGTYVGKWAGDQSGNTSSNNVVIGALAGRTITTGGGNIVLGRSAEPSSGTAAGEFVAGSGNAPVTNVYFGEGAVNSSPLDYTIRGTSGSGPGTAGGNLNLAGGTSGDAATAGGNLNLAGGTSGDAAPAGGALVLQTASAGSGQTLTPQLIVTNGWLVVPSLPTTTNGFAVSGTLWNSNGVLRVWTGP